MRFATRKTSARRAAPRPTLRVGFVPTLDCAVLIAARELGLFGKYGLRVELSREIGWATTRDKLLHEELDAVAGHASLLVSIYLGLGVIRRPCLTGLMLGANGSAITLSNELRELGVRDAASLALRLREGAMRRTPTLGIVLELSSQNFHLRGWLARAGIDPDRDVRLAVVPSPLVFDAFQRGHLDGYCVAEPWNSAAVGTGLGWVAATTSELDPGHPEKALLVLREFAERRDEEHVRLIAAMIEASRFCDRRENRPELVRMLSRPGYFEVPSAWLANSLVGPFDTGRGERWVEDMIVYDASRVGSPSRARGRRILDQVAHLTRDGAAGTSRRAIIPRLFREDLFRRALALCGHPAGEAGATKGQGLAAAEGDDPAAREETPGFPGAFWDAGVPCPAEALA